MADFIQWLDNKVSKVAALEAKGRELLKDDSGGDAYRAVMRDKALLLAGLAEEGEASLSSLPEDLRGTARARLRRFSAGAENARRLDSVFFMSALLFPEDHKEGQPNDLELFREELKTRL